MINSCLDLLFGISPRKSKLLTLVDFVYLNLFCCNPAFLKEPGFYSCHDQNQSTLRIILSGKTGNRRHEHLRGGRTHHFEIWNQEKTWERGKMFIYCHYVFKKCQDKSYKILHSYIITRQGNVFAVMFIVLN